MPKPEKGNNSFKFWQNFMKSESGDLHHVSQLYAWYHDPSSSGCPDILFTRLLFHTKRQSRKRELIQSTTYRNLPKVNQVIYTLDTFCIPNIMTLAQAVLEIVCSQGPLWVKCLRPKRGIIQSKFDRILWKVNQVLYIMYPNCKPDIMILAQAVLHIFCCFTTQNDKVGKGR